MLSVESFRNAFSSQVKVRECDDVDEDEGARLENIGRHQRAEIAELLASITSAGIATETPADVPMLEPS